MSDCSGFKGSPDLAAAVKAAFEAHDRFAPKKPEASKDNPFAGVFSGNSPVAAFISLGKRNSLFKIVSCVPSVMVELEDEQGKSVSGRADEIAIRFSILGGVSPDKAISPALTFYKRHDTGLYYKGQIWGKKVWDLSNGIAWTEEELFQNIVEWATGYASENPEKREELVATVEGRKLSGFGRWLSYEIRGRLGL